MSPNPPKRHRRSLKDLTRYQSSSQLVCCELPTCQAITSRMVSIIGPKLAPASTLARCSEYAISSNGEQTNRRGSSQRMFWNRVHSCDVSSPSYVTKTQASESRASAPITCRADFIFYADRIIRLLVEEGVTQRENRTYPRAELPTRD